MQKKHKRRFITDTPQIITGAGFYSDERRAIDDFMARHAKHLQTRSA